MIKSIKIKNFLTIKNLEIDLNSCFNAIIGESGAGKSLVLKAINEIFSPKNDISMIGKFDDESIISIDFESDLSAYSFSDSNFSIMKILKKNKSNLMLNNKPISSKMAQNIKNNIVHIVSQDYRFELFDKDKFLDVLDLFIEPNIIEDYKIAFDSFNETKKTVQEFEAKIEMLDKQHPEILIDLIDKTNPQVDEYDILINKRKQIKQELLLKDVLQNLNSMFFAESNNVYDEIIGFFKKTYSIESEKILTIRNSLNKILDELLLIKPLFNEQTDDDVSIDNIEKRLFELETLQRKFGKTINEILEEKKRLSRLIENKLYMQEQLLKEKEKLHALKDKLSYAADMLTSARKEQAKLLVDGVKQNIADLMMESADLDIVFEKTPYSEKGQDKITLLFSANKDLAKKELSKIASGGEKSRFILALFEYVSNNNTIIFDEIEEGTGGKTLMSIVSKLKKISLKNQIICITHAKDIQEAADKVFRIEKAFENSNTVTYLCQNQM